MKMTLENIKTPEDILQFMRDNIIYAWLDDKKQPHINNNKDGRKLYRTFSVEEALEYKFGTCIEQVSMMSMLLDKLNIPNKMYCIRIYDGKDWKLYAKGEFVHCFVLYFLNGKVYQLEHPNWERIGIHEYNSEEEAVKDLVNYYIEVSEGKAKPVTVYKDVPLGISVDEFCKWIDDLEDKIYV